MGLEQTSDFSKFRMGMSALGSNLAGRGASASRLPVSSTGAPAALLTFPGRLSS